MKLYQPDDAVAKGWFAGPWDSDLDISIGYANTSVDEPHYHKTMREIYLFARGSGTMLVDNQRIEIPEGAVIVIEPGEVHALLECSEDHYHFVVQTPGLHGVAARADKVVLGAAGAAPEFGACAFFHDEPGRRVLLHHRDRRSGNPGKWAFFGGGSRPGETPVQCCIREVAEETGIGVSEEEAVPIRDYFNRHTGYHRHVFCVRRYVPESEIRLTEGQGFAWMPEDDLSDYDLVDTVRADLSFFLGRSL